MSIEYVDDYIFKEGDIVIATYGEYSDYGMTGLFRANKSFDARPLIKTLLNEKSEYDVSGDAILNELIKNEVLEEIAGVRELHLQLDKQLLDAVGLVREAKIPKSLYGFTSYKFITKEKQKEYLEKQDEFKNKMEGFL